MKRWLFIGLLATNAAAQVLQPADPTRQADVNGKTFPSANVDLITAPQPSRSYQQLPQPFQRLGLKRVELGSVELQRADLATKPMAVQPQVNFIAKRAAETDQVRVQETLRQGKAPITDHEIRAFTPSGEEELKNQLRDPR